MPAEVRATRLAQRGAEAHRTTTQMRVVAAVELGEVARDLALASGMSITHAAKRIVKDAAVQTLQLAQVYAPKATGELRSSLRITYDRSGLSADVYAAAPYAAYVEFGTGLHNELLPAGMRRPYIIEPTRPGGMLRFIGAGGEVVYTRRVIHPGIQPQPYLRPAAERVAESFSRGLGTAGVKLIVEGQ